MIQYGASARYLAGLAAVGLCMLASLAVSPPADSLLETEEASNPPAAVGSRIRIPIAKEPTGLTPQAALAQALDRVRGQAPDQDEVYSLVTVTHRQSGQRLRVTRGELSPGVLSALQDPSTAPSGQAYWEGEDFTVDGDVEVAVRSVHVRQRRLDPGALTGEEEEEHKLLREVARSGVPYRLGKMLRDDVKSGKLRLESPESVRVSIDLREIPRLRLPKARSVGEGALFWARLELAGEREKAIIQRKRDVAQEQAGLRELIESRGGQVLYASWTSGSIEAEVPASLLPALSRHPDTLVINKAPQWTTTVYYDGMDIWEAMDAQDFDKSSGGHGHEGVRGLESRHAYSDRVVLALSEECLDQEFPGFLTGDSSWNRGWYYDCDPSGSCTEGGVEDCSARHGTQVAQVMVGDFMDGQDPALDENAARRQTGTCEECRFFFLQDQKLDQRHKAWDAACELGIDLFESSIASAMSDGTPLISCDGNHSSDANIQALINCDVAYVQSAGNSGSTGGCTTSPPADHPWTLTIGGINTSSPCDQALDYYTGNCAYDVDASKGGADYDGGVGVASIIDLAAPFRLGRVIKPWTSPPLHVTVSGTSFSAPIVAGLAARMMDWYYYHISSSIFYDNRLRAFMLLFGDRSYSSAGTSRALNFMDTRWGAGRVGLVPFDDLAHINIGRRDADIDRNDTWALSQTLDPEDTFYKAIVWHDGKDYSGQPAIGLTLNPTGCSTASKSVVRYDNKVVLVFTGSSSLEGCTGMDITIENISTGGSGSRHFHFASYGTTEDERNY